MREDKRKVIITILFSLLFIGTSIYFWVKSSDVVEETKENEKNTVVKKEKTKDIEEETMIVDIKGEVNTPGIYEVPANTRVMDVITSAGGLTDEADTSGINLSKIVTDEMVIIVDKKGEVTQNNEVTNGARITANDAILDSKGNNSQSSGPVSINQASKEALMTLPGIGETKATAIISYRETHGGFKSLEELMEVNGIGESTFNKIKANITL